MATTERELERARKAERAAFKKSCARAIKACAPAAAAYDRYLNRGIREARYAAAPMNQTDIESALEAG